MVKPRNLQCADNGGALDFLTFCGICESKAASRCACRRTPNRFFSTLLKLELQTDSEGNGDN
jgi:hypothetical protein